MKGIVMAGGVGTRLYPITQGVSKHLLPVYDKPLIYYSLSALMLAGIREILLICASDDLPSFRRLLDDGARFGIQLHYKVQPRPDGIAQGLLLAEEYIGGETVALVLGDNLYFGQGLSDKLQKAAALQRGARLFCYPVQDPSRFGVIELDQNGIPVGIEEKPAKPRSNYAVTGIYFYDHQVVDIAKALQPSGRGELEITDVNLVYLREELLEVDILGRDFTWLDAGTPDSMLEASHFIQTMERRQNFKIACLEEIAWRKGWLSADVLRQQCAVMPSTPYRDYLLNFLQQKEGGLQ